MSARIQHLTDQHGAVGAGGTLAATDRARLWREQRHGSLECLTALFRRHRYLPHTHDTFVIGVIEAGCEAFHLGGVRHLATAGSLCLVNPGEVHDGAPAEDGYAYRMTYPSEQLLRAVASERQGRRMAIPRFRDAVVQDPQGYALLRRAHLLLEAAAPPLAADEALLEAYGWIVARHAEDAGPTARLPSAPDAVARARDWLDAHHTERVDLATLAAVAGLSSTHLVRAFRRATGLTPHAWQTDRRIRTARQMLARGQAPAEVAAACGFCDQSHLNRAFRARVGVAPGGYRA
ncbi:L-rhamnose operon transcriptional activator RhaR [Rhodovastum atsumiense]|uniref:AraC family transcriptional regulator n=1 Tax=Rhodovastum atsumiense TaxID=504468 RepID=A0A5M6IYZ7_9PROT|nr:AraC family transcriptional regulator [Rhodovastum atsumiense]KAA5612588.1 AraC family transcriptional regulator [Rhodovastum atsumiense]CAH2601316.1 L-rhamnose operon transcriptional activator RhaR [Rhodovastum atsumiense]